MHPRGVRGEAGLPDRSLPGQGDRAEHPGVPVRERPVRAHLEPPLPRSCADHRGRIDRDRGARRVLRADRRHPRPGLHAPVPDDDVPGHGAAGQLRARPVARRDREGAAVGAVLRSDEVGPRSVRGIPLRARRGRRLEHGDVRGAPGRHRQLALGRRAVLPPDGQGPREEVDGDHAEVPQGAVQRVPWQRHRSPAARPPDASGSSPTRASRSPSTRRSPVRASSSAGSRWTSTTTRSSGLR